MKWWSIVETSSRDKPNTLDKLELVYLPKGQLCISPNGLQPGQCDAPRDAPPPILDNRKWISIAFLAISDQYATFFSRKMAASGWPKITFDRISHHFRSIRNFFSQNGCQRLFWMTRKSLLIAFLAISDQNTTLFFHKMAASGHFGWPENHFWSHFSPFQINTQLFFHKMAASGHFGWPKITFDRISHHFRSIHNFFFHKMAASGHFGWPKIAFDHISRHFRSIHNFDFFIYFFHKMAAGGHFGWPKITFECISRHFRSIRNFFYFWVFFSKWPIWAISDDRKSLSIAFLAISDQYTTFFSFFFSKWPPAAYLEVQFAPKTIGFFYYVLSMAMPNMKLIGEFVTQLEMPQAFWFFLYKMAARGHFAFPIDDKNHRVLVIWDLNGYGEYEFNRCICDKVMACTSVGVRRRRRRRRRWRRRRRRNQKHNITEIFKFRGYNYTWTRKLTLYRR